MSDLIDVLREGLGDEFEIVRPLGEGSVARVFLGREKSLDRPVAIKVLRSELAVEGTPRKRFVREAKLSAKIQHANVVDVYRVGTVGADDHPYLVMEYIDGRTLEDALAATGPLPIDEVRRIVTEVAEALDQAHALGIIHRDVRPGNIMQTRNRERIILTDFGLAGILETGSEVITKLTRAGQILGNVRYAPPEQLQGDAVQPGSDLYSLAVTAYELLTGEGPYGEQRAAAKMIQAHISEEPAPLSRLRPGADRTLEDVLLRCLAKRPEHRPSAALVVERLRAEPGEAPAPKDGFSGFLNELKRRHVYKVGAAYGGFIIVVLAFVDAALPNLPFDTPEWTATAIVTATLAGLPLTLVLAWFYDLTARGVERTPSVGAARSRTGRLLQLGGLLLSLAVAGLIWWVVVR